MTKKEATAAIAEVAKYIEAPRGVQPAGLSVRIGGYQVKKNREVRDDNAPAKAGTRILACSCKSAFQDDNYGPGRRLHNVTRAGGSRCTVCLKVK